MADTAKEVFISYHRATGSMVMHQIRTALEEAGISCWYDERNIEGGPYAEKIVQAIDDCGVFLLILDRGSNASLDCLREVHLASDRLKRHETITILPIRVDGCTMSRNLRYNLAPFQMIDLGRAPEEDDLRDLVRRVAYILGRAPAMPEKPTQERPKTPPSPPQVTPTPQKTTAEPPKVTPTPTQTWAQAPAVITRRAPIVIDDASKAFPPQEGRWVLRQTLSAGDWHTVGIQRDGSVVATGDNSAGNGQCNVQGWRDIVSVSGGNWHTAGLRQDGTVLAMGSNGEGECKVDGWKDVVAVSAGTNFTVGLRKDGSLLSAGNRSGCPVGNWRGIVSVATGGFHTVGLRQDGIVTAGGDPSRKVGQCDVSGWKEIVSIATGWRYTMGLRRDGTVVMTGRYDFGTNKPLSDVSGWRDIVMVAGGHKHTVGLRRGGTVAAVGDSSRFRGVEKWRDIVSISAGALHTVGLRKDGTVLSAGSGGFGQCRVSTWRLRLPEWVPWEDA